MTRPDVTHHAKQIQNVKNLLLKKAQAIATCSKMDVKDPSNQESAAALSKQKKKLKRERKLNLKKVKKLRKHQNTKKKKLPWPAKIELS